MVAKFAKFTPNFWIYSIAQVVSWDRSFDQYASTWFTSKSILTVTWLTLNCTTCNSELERLGSNRKWPPPLSWNYVTSHSSIYRPAVSPFFRSHDGHTQNTACVSLIILSGDRHIILSLSREIYLSGGRQIIFTSHPDTSGRPQNHRHVARTVLLLITFSTPAVLHLTLSANFVVNQCVVFCTGHWRAPLPRTEFFRFE